MRLLYEKVPFRISESIRAVAWSWPQVTCPYHYHSELELVWIQKSTGRVSIGDYQGTFEEGDLFLIGSNLPHVFYNTEEHESKPGAAKALVIQFSENFLGEKTWKIPELMEIGKTIHLAKRGFQLKIYSGTTLDRRMKKILHSTTVERVTLLLQILEECSHEENRTVLQNLSTPQGTTLKADERIQKILTYLSDHLNERITLTALSKYLFMTTSSLSRFFSQKMGISLIDYINSQRIALSCQLLAGSERTITEICFEVGFENLSNFNRQFLKRKQCSPREFRQFYQKKPK